MPSQLLALTQRFPYLRLRLFLHLQQDGQLPAFKGSLWHGWLGHMLKASPELYHILYGEHDQQQPKPYLIRTDSNRQQQWQRNSVISFDLILLGHGCELAEQIVQQLICTPPKPLGPAQLKVRLHSVATVTQTGLKPGIYPGTLADWLAPLPVTLWHEVALQLDSPLRLKYQGQILRRPEVPLPLLLEQIARRLMLLTRYWVDDDPLVEQAIRAELPVLGEYQTQGTMARFEDWQRFSVRQGEKLPFGGLLGQLCYQGDIGPAVFWLQLGELLQLGGKTSFGLGQYQLIA